MATAEPAWRTALAVVAAVGLALSSCSPPTSSATVAAPGAARTDGVLAYGVLASSCDPTRAAAEHDAGVTATTLELAWDRYEPAAHQFDPRYAADIRRKVESCRRAGLQVTLGLGLQYPPSWVRDLADARYVDQYRNPSVVAEANIVFSQAVRNAAADYLRQVASDLGFDNFAAMRVGTSRTGELGFPGPIDGNDDGAHDYWGFDDAAQTGQGLASGATVSPMPGWVPGMTRWHDQPVTADQTAAWFAWYTGSLVQAISWQTDVLVGLGFTGEFHLPVPGRGALPADRRQAVGAHLDGRGDPDGNLERGLDYPNQFPLLAALDKHLGSSGPHSRLVVDFTGLDDISTVRARAAHNDACLPDDTHELLTRSGVEAWAAGRWTVANAHLVGLAAIGENPGPPDDPHTGGAPDSDDETAQLRYAPGYADGCRLEQFLFAFEDELFEGGSGVTLADYARQIATHR